MVAILDDLRQQAQARNSLRRNNSMLSQIRAKGVDKLRSLADKQIARPEEHRAGLLVLCLGNHEPHRRAEGRLDDGLGVSRIILLSFDEGLT